MTCYLNQGANDLVRMVGKNTIQPYVVQQESACIPDAADFRGQFVCAQGISVNKQPQLLCTGSQI